MIERDDDKPVGPEYMAGYVCYGNGGKEEDNPFDYVTEEPWREINRRFLRWKQGFREAQSDSLWCEQ